MKRNLIFAFLFLGLGFTIFSRKSENAALLVSPNNQSNRVLQPSVAKTVEIQEPDLISSQYSQPKTLEPLPESMSESEEKCWRKVKSQVKPGSFLAQNQSALSSTVGDWFFNKNDFRKTTVEASKSGKFLLALAKAGLLNEKNEAPDNKSAIDLLKEVVQLDPQNSAPLLYWAYLEGLESHPNEQKIAHILNRTKKTLRFDSYLPTITKSIFALVHSPADLVQAIELWRTISVPDYAPIKSLLVSNRSIDLAQQLMADGLNPLITQEFEWVPLEYGNGRSIAREIDPGFQALTFHELKLSRANRQIVDPDRVMEDLGTACDVEVLRPQVTELEIFFKP